MGNAESRARAAKSRHATSAEKREPRTDVGDSNVEIPRPLTVQANIGIDDFELLKVVGKGR